MRYSFEIKEQAKSMFKAGEPLTEIAKKMSLPLSVVKSWYYRNKWSGDRKKFKEDLAKKSDTSLQKMILKKQDEFIIKNINISEKITDKAKHFIEKASDEKELKAAAGAAKTGFEIGSQVLGVGDATKRQQQVINVSLVGCAVTILKQAKEKMKEAVVISSEVSEPLQIEDSEQAS